MRTIIVAGVSLLTLAAGIAGAQAQMLADSGAAATMLRGSDFGESRSPGKSASGRSGAVMTAEAVAPGEQGSVATPSHAVAAPVKKAADSWCRSGRIAGTGTGFCLIN